jgi:hypothetical protein
MAKGISRTAAKDSPIFSGNFVISSRKEINKPDQLPATKEDPEKHEREIRGRNDRTVRLREK